MKHTVYHHTIVGIPSTDTVKRLNFAVKKDRESVRVVYMLLEPQPVHVCSPKLEIFKRPKELEDVEDILRRANQSLNAENLHTPERLTLTEDS